IFAHLLTNPRFLAPHGSRFTDSSPRGVADSNAPLDPLPSWYPAVRHSARRVGASIPQHPFLWSLGVLLVLWTVFQARLEGSLSAAILFCLGAYLWGLRRPPAQPQSLTDPRQKG